MLPKSKYLALHQTVKQVEKILLLLICRKILNDLSSDSPVKVEPFEESNTGSSEATDDSPSSEGNEPGSVNVQASSADGMPMQGMQAIQIPSTNGQGQQATVVQFNGQVLYFVISFLICFSAFANA